MHNLFIVTFFFLKKESNQRKIQGKPDRSARFAWPAPHLTPRQPANIQPTTANLLYNLLYPVRLLHQLLQKFIILLLQCRFEFSKLTDMFI
jgi:hypothetical protein